jgi:hypothetical protein
MIHTHAHFDAVTDPAAALAALLDRILLETDRPVRFGQCPSEPADLLLTAKHFTRIRQLDVSVVSEVTTKTAERFFGFPDEGRFLSTVTRPFDRRVAT